MKHGRRLPPAPRGVVAASPPEAALEGAGGVVAVCEPEDIPAGYRGTPVGDLLEYHNLGRAHPRYERPELVIGMCMDHRNRLRIPDNFAYVLRAGGANLRRIEFKLSFAIAVGGVRTIALIGHDRCGMVGLRGRREEFVRGLVERGGWTQADAAAHFDENAGVFEIADAAEFVAAEARRLRARYPRVRVAPLFYKVGDGRLYQVAEAR